MSGLPSYSNTSYVIPIAQLATGTPDGTKYIRDDGALAVPPGTYAPSVVITPLATSGAQNVDCSLGNIFTLTPVGATTLTITNATVGQFISIVTLTSGVTGYEITFDSTFIVQAGSGIINTGATSGVYMHWLFRALGASQVIAVVYPQQDMAAGG